MPDPEVFVIADETDDPREHMPVDDGEVETDDE